MFEAIRRFIKNFRLLKREATSTNDSRIDQVREDFYKEQRKLKELDDRLAQIHTEMEYSRNYLEATFAYLDRLGVLPLEPNEEESKEKEVEDEQSQAAQAEEFKTESIPATEGAVLKEKEDEFPAPVKVEEFNPNFNIDEDK